MSALHSISTTAVGTTRTRTCLVPARCDVTGNTASGAANRLGSHRGIGHPRPAHLSAVDASGGKTGESGGTRGNGGTGEAVRGARREGVTEAEFTAYVRERRASLYATAYHLTGDRHEAEDLLQSALLSTYRAWERITDKAAVGGYLRRTMTNLHISAWRRRKLNEYPTEELPEAPGEYDTMRGTELRTVLWQALARLPEQQRTMLVLRYYEGQTDPEIAATLNISVGTVKSSIWRTLRRLREDRSLSMGRDVEESFGELVA
ncbi:SigE family RNA polymerase sigma factor [Streptomyces carpaticus]|uniref:RNA polymerase sigma-70 factor, sigma-E family n=2 Tax=Streptomyces TaxID=1883 RepID=A0A1I6TVD4_9ACTN|nr:MULTISPECIES: SigE family RNA polymerase sigma factor [Streptomyces]QKV70402.1 SigE family RNA polymerase sigma factor [Streptomyces harbinensis]UWM50827.1 SigE family RNA polymerase sigma factor [Streptomyces carpaticus]SFS93209.1 RNA polymerase sigma-70 factor, sigma-E family [Streptomyces harbinensis]